MVKAIIFDFDLTLIDSFYIDKKIRDILEEKYGITQKSFSVKEAFGMKHEEWAKAFEKDNPNSLKWQEIDKINLKLMDQLYKTEVLKNIDLLQELNKKEIKLGIISGNTTKTIKDFLNNKDNKGKVKFDYILTTDGKYERKTKADLIKESLKFWKIERQDCIYVGDHPNDIIAGKESGVISAGVSTGLYSKEELKTYNPDILIENLDELKKFIS
jgi:pyrophosphatase PpaX